MSLLKKFSLLTAIAKAMRATTSVALGIQGAALLLPPSSEASTIPVTVLFAALAGGFEIARNFWKQNKK